MRQKIVIAVLVLLCLAACKPEIQEVEVQLIPLAAPLNEPLAQLSGMTWCKGRLLLLPERPWFESAANEKDPEENYATYLYEINIDDVEAHIDGKATSPIVPKRIVLVENGIRPQLNNFDGYEAIMCKDDNIWFALEVEPTTEIAETALVKAVLITDETSPKIVIDNSTIVAVRSQSNLENYSDESLLWYQGKVLSLHEANGNMPHLAPVATLTHWELAEQSELPMPAVPYRITDVTELDENNTFWAINYLWKSESDRFSVPEPKRPGFNKGPTHQLEQTVERLIEFKIVNNRVAFSDRAPIQLRLSQEDGRNWEGIARFGDRGFLLVTDQYPQTYFGFVPLPKH